MKLVFKKNIKNVLLLCFFVILANSDFDDPTDYEGPFKSVSVTIRRIKAYVATSSTCVSIGGGWHSKMFAMSSTVSYYTLLTSSYSSLGSIRYRVESKIKYYL